MTFAKAPSGTFRVFAIAASVWAGVLFVISAIAIARHGDRTLERGWTGDYDGRALIVRKVDPGGPASGRLFAGDQVVAVDGDHRLTRIIETHGLASQGLLPPGRDYTLSVRRDGREQVVALPSREGRSSEQRWASVSLLVASAFWCGVPALLVIYRSGQPIARIAYLACLMVGMATLAEARLPVLPWVSSGWQHALWLVYPFSPLHLALGYHLYSRFPSASAAGRPWRALGVTLYALCGALCLEGPLLDTAVGLIAPDRLPTVRSLLAPLDRWFEVETAVFPLAGLAIVAVVVRNWRAVQSPADRLRLRWLVWGTTSGIAPFVLVVNVMALATLAGASLDMSRFVLLSNILTGVIPLTLSYAIVKHHLFDVAVVVRKGLRYLLARNALRSLLAIPVVALLYGVIVNPQQSVSQLFLSNFTSVALIVAALASLWFRSPLMHWLDRRFFREAYDRERILVELIEEVKDLESASSVSRFVSHELEAAFHPHCLFLWYRETDHATLTLSYSSGGYVHHAELKAGSPLVQLVERLRSIITLPLADDRWLPETDRQWLGDQKVSLIVPIFGSGRDVLGLLMLGDKKSDEPYSADDLKLLHAVARQIGIGRDNLRLQERVHHDRRVRHTVLSQLDTGGFNLLKECPHCGKCYDAVATACEADGAELVLSLPIERTIDNKYRLERLIGKGGMGVVYEATDLRLARVVAVKILLGNAFGNQTALRRFEREAQACARLAHPNVVTAFDFGPVGAEGAFLVMEFVRGHNLRAELRNCGRLTPARAVDWFGQICAGVSAAHQNDVVHRDLKPENVLITVDSLRGHLLKVADFGLAKMRAPGAPGSSLTSPGVVMGTMAYMAPEQLVGGDVDARTDIFSLGVMVAEAVTGHPPFKGRTHGELLAAILNDRVTLEARPELRELERVLREATAKEPADRYGSVAQFADRLSFALRQLEEASTGPPSVSDSTGG